jgi:hypothetical protein
MKPIVVAVLLLLAVATIVSGYTAESNIDFDDAAESGKCPVIQWQTVSRLMGVKHFLQ